MKWLELILDRIADAVMPIDDVEPSGPRHLILAMLAEVNLLRSRHGIGPLAERESLRIFADHRAKQMAHHDSLMIFRGCAAKLTAQIAPTREGSVHQAFRSWCEDPEARALLLGEFHAAGVGVATAASGTMYWTLDLA